MRGLKFLANVLAFVSALVGAFDVLKNRMPIGLALWFPKLLAGAVSPFAFLFGLAGALLGLVSRSPFALAAGTYGAYATGRYVRRVTDFNDGFAEAFGENWERSIPQGLEAKMLPSHWTWRISPPPEIEPRRDVPFATIPSTERRVLCDLWLPPAEVDRSGLAFLYLHGSGWYLGDKDLGTRFLFRHLAAQGHTVMDIAYRMSPETDMYGMVGDAKRAVAWMKQNGERFGVNPERIVIGGGSAGAQLALLAAYTPDDPRLNPDELQGTDLTVRGAVSFYGPTDLVASYYHSAQHRLTRGLPRRLEDNPETVINRAGERLLGDMYERPGLNKRLQTGAFVYLLGGHPDQAREMYELFSPVNHVHPGCPPTLLIHGQDDFVVPAPATSEMARKLRDAGVPVVLVLLAQTEHAFDLVLPRWSPPAQAAIYELERFLVLLASPRPAATPASRRPMGHRSAA